MEITPAEGRVLGCLVEKELTTPQQYPLTDNALIAACNQTTSRDPVVRYDLTTVRVAVRSLREKELLRTVHRSGERSDKHRHELPAALGLSPAQVAVLAVLLLRGPQTAAELRARTERMHAFSSVTEVEHVLQALADREPPLVTRLERQPGRREDRFAEALVGTVPGQARQQPDAAAADREGADEHEGHRPPAAPDEVGALHEQVAALRAEVAELGGRVAALQSEVAALRVQPDDRPT